MRRRRIIGLLTETVRHTLAAIGPSAPGRAERLAELEEMAVGYMAHRLGLPIPTRTPPTDRNAPIAPGAEASTGAS